jgi:Abi-like protein
LTSSYSPEFLASIERTITRERLTRYLNAVGQDLPRALELYEYNVQLSEVLYGLLHGLEVTVRNAEHHALTAGYGTPTWYDAARLSQYWQDQLTKAKAKPGVAGKPGKVVAELTFGFWIDLLQNQNHRSLWVNRKLHAAFPHARRHRSLIHERLKQIQLLRNRISHHEPVLTAANVVYNGDTVLSVPQLLECVEWVCPEAARWMRAKFRYEDAERVLRTVAATRVPL